MKKYCLIITALIFLTACNIHIDKETEILAEHIETSKLANAQKDKELFYTIFWHETPEERAQYWHESSGKSISNYDYIEPLEVYLFTDETVISDIKHKTDLLKADNPLPCEPYYENTYKRATVYGIHESFSRTTMLYPNAEGYEGYYDFAKEIIQTGEKRWLYNFKVPSETNFTSLMDNLNSDDNILAYYSDNLIEEKPISQYPVLYLEYTYYNESIFKYRDDEITNIGELGWYKIDNIFLPIVDSLNDKSLIAFQTDIQQRSSSYREYCISTSRYIEIYLNSELSDEDFSQLELAWNENIAKNQNYSSNHFSYEPAKEYVIKVITDKLNDEELAELESRFDIEQAKIYSY